MGGCPDIRVVKMERIFTNLHGYLWFLLPNLMEKKNPWLVLPKKVSLDGGRSHFKMAAEAPDMVSPTFFLWEIIQKFFFLAWGFHILATRKNIFCHPGGSQWVPVGLLACFRAKKGYFGTNVDKNQSLLAF